MRPAHRLTFGLAFAALLGTGVLALAGAASAQPAGEARGLRYLSWNNRTEAAVQPPATSAPAEAPRRDLRRPNRVIPHGGFAAVEASPRTGEAAPSAARRTLTPANAWLRSPARTPAPVPVATPAPQPVRPAAAAPPRATPDYLPDQGGRGQTVPADAVEAPPVPPAEPVARPLDPMAPRRDAPIFRMQRDTPAPQPPTSPAAPEQGEVPAGPARVAEVAGDPGRPPQHGARYYSVHRQIGRQPDALEMPEPGYVEALAVGEIETLASQDLAAPEPGPTLIRDANGRIRPQPAASEGDHQ